MSKENDNERGIDSKVIHKFFGAISQRDFGVVEEMCKSIPGIVNLKNFHGDAPLHVAVNLNHLGMMDFLIQKGANVDCLDARNRTPLSLLVANSDSWVRQLGNSSHEEAMKLLVNNGANVNLVDNSGETALYKATEHVNKKLIKYLCNNGAKVHVERAMDPIKLAESKLKYAYINADYFREIMNVLERAVHPAEHPSVFRQAKQVMVNALGNLSLSNSSTAPSAASNSQAKQKQQGASQGYDNKGFARE